MDNEIWKTYPEVSFIQGSSWGRVRTINRYVSDSRYGKRLVKEHVLKQYRHRKGYLYVTLHVNGKTVTRLVHRIIAECFIPNPDNLPQVNHKDCDRTKNCVDNLEWCDNSYNQRYREDHGKAFGRPVIAVNTKTAEVLRFKSQSEASRKLEVSLGQINNVIAGKRNHTHGYWFTNADDNAVEAVRNKFGDEVAEEVEKLMNEKELQTA